MNEPESPDLALAVSYAPRRARAGVAALLALDRRLATIVRRAREPVAAQMRLTWWFEALERLDGAAPPAEPVLRAVSMDALPLGVTGASLAAMVDGWDTVLDDAPLDRAAADLFARARGGGLFAAMALACGARDGQAATAGEGWALADLAANLSDPKAAARIGAQAVDRLRAGTAVRWSREGRALGALALIARFELEGRAPAARIGRLLVLRATGR